MQDKRKITHTILSFVLFSSASLLIINVWGQLSEKAQIVYVSGVVETREIFVMDADGTNKRRLTNNAFADTSPAWSPDGEKIAFMSERDGNWEIYVMDADE
jgi:Tol biopolymer transport system component